MGGIITRLSHTNQDGGALGGKKDVTGTDIGAKRGLDINLVSRGVNLGPKVLRGTVAGMSTSPAYTAKDAMGSGTIKFSGATLSNGGSCSIVSVVAVNISAKTPQMRVHFFNTARSFTDNAALNPSDSRMTGEFINSLNITAWADLTSNSFSTEQIYMPFTAASDDDSIYVGLQFIAGTFTAASTTEITIILGLAERS